VEAPGKPVDGRQADKGPDAAGAAPGSPVRKGRPPKGRGAPTGGDKGVDKWTIRGVPLNVRRLATAEAERRGLTTGDFVAEAVVAHAKGKAGAPEVSAGDSGGVPARSQPDDIAGALDALNRRLAAMEESRELGLFGRLFGRRK